MTDVLRMHPVGIRRLDVPSFFSSLFDRGCGRCRQRLCTPNGKAHHGCLALAEKICGIDGRAQNESRTVRAQLDPTPAEQTPKAEKPPRKPQTARTFNSNGSGQAQKRLFNRVDLKEAAQIFKRAAE